ncbi:retinol dehydrogenase 12 [Cryptotermes secundus]|uniref:retinol dehydrogenase 12 n=1 Tax=Cryptotermes secundus TaxID=105785 RepID=UPI000CD7D68D|nr:retinol dehydrogenase 12 [Cryptotermes secundus]XP_023727298.1 retinol dehydrogenase 12 [Cryptotermes secundus]XP_023727299.1 retinol dehydrogenase 12 [Cryptotermes secundus]XP_023727300.1 retinol dehydrogenase 12 [Cryptotermes secundus]
MLRRKCRSKARLDGKTVVITGANTGIGKGAALDLASRGGRVILACRDLKRAQDAADDIRKQTSGIEGAGEVLVVRLDLASLASVRECAQLLLRTEKHIHILVNNAGMCFCPKGLTEDGFETQLGVNHFGHFLFTCLLLPRIIQSAPARIIMVSSSFHHMDPDIPLDDVAWENRPYSTFKAYSQSKLANILFAKELAVRLQGTGVTTYALNPGRVKTEALRYADDSMFRGATRIFGIIGFMSMTPLQGAQTIVYCAVDEKVAEESGLYYSNCRKDTPSRAARDPVRAQRLWEASARLVGLGDWDPFTAEVLPSDSGEVTKF